METNTKIFFGVLVLFFLVLIIGLTSKNKEEVLSPYVENTVQENRLPESFSWRFEDGANNLDGIPGTKILLDIKYEDGNMVTELIDEVAGSCNEIDKTDEDIDMVPETAKIQCYGAGFGQRYKITEDEISYKVQRKNFEEGLPDYTPPDYQYEVIFEIPLV